MGSFLKYTGLAAWLASKKNDLENAWLLYEATRSDDAALEVARRWLRLLTERQ
jgi:hypothetical protein